MWSREFFWKYFLVRRFLLEMPTFTEASKFKFGRYEFAKKAVYNYRPEGDIRKSHETKLKKALTRFIFQRVYPV